MSKPAFERGRLVISKQGHDKGLAFIILDVMDGDYVTIADGETRKAEKPKKKKMKHLIPKPALVTLTLPVTDSDLRKAIRAIAMEGRTE